MLKTIFASWLRSLSEVDRLKPRYQRITKYLGFGSVAAGCAIELHVMYYSRLWLGVPMGEVSLDGIRLKFPAWITACIVSVPYSIYLGCIIIYGTYGLTMYLLGKFFAHEAGRFSLYAEPPRYWFSENT
jgi:hypothetical protein